MDQLHVERVMDGVVARARVLWNQTDARAVLRFEAACAAASQTERATAKAERRALRLEKQLGRLETKISNWPTQMARGLSKSAHNGKKKGKK